MVAASSEIRHEFRSILHEFRGFGQSFVSVPRAAQLGVVIAVPDYIQLESIDNGVGHLDRTVESGKQFLVGIALDNEITETELRAFV